MTLTEAKKLVEWARSLNLKRVKSGTFEVEFYPQDEKEKVNIEPMRFDPKSLADVLGDTMPPDSEMLFSSSDGLLEDEEDEEPKSKQRDSAKMT